MDYKYQRDDPASFQGRLFHDGEIMNPGINPYLCGFPHIKMTWKEERIETQRILFRPWKESDAEALFKYAADPDVGPRAGWPPHGSVADSLEVIRKFFSNDHTWALVLKETGEPIGCMGYYPYGESNISIGENDAEPETLRSVFDKLFAEETLTSITDS